MRYTPAGLPALEMQLEHESSIEEVGQTRQVKVTIKAVAFGTMAERLCQQAVGSAWGFTGFLANARGGRHVVLHVLDFQSD